MTIAELIVGFLLLSFLPFGYIASYIGAYTTFLFLPIIFIILGIIIGLIMFRKGTLFGVRILVVWYSMVAIWASFVGIILTYLNIVRPELPSLMLTTYKFGNIYTVITAIFFIGLAVFSFFIVKGLLKKQNWTRIAVIILAGLWIVSTICIGVAMMISGFALWVISVFALPLLVINIAVISYLMFNRKVKAAFYIN